MTNDSTMSKLAARPAIAGLTLIELMVALAIGMFLMIGAVTVFAAGLAVSAFGARRGPSAGAP